MYFLTVLQHFLYYSVITVTIQKFKPPTHHSIVFIGVYMNIYLY